MVGCIEEYLLPDIAEEAGFIFPHFEAQQLYVLGQYLIEICRLQVGGVNAADLRHNVGSITRHHVSCIQYVDIIIRVMDLRAKFPRFYSVENALYLALGIT